MGQVGLLLRGVRREALHLLCSTNRVPLSYELTAANAADVLLVRELLAGAGLLDEGGVARRLFGDLAYRSGALKEKLAEEASVLLATERADRRPALRQQVERDLLRCSQDHIRAGRDAGQDAGGAGNSGSG